MESRFRYQVTPYSPIKDLIPGQSIRRPFTSDLSKEEVLLCMKHGPVCRLFPGKLPIKVTGSNIDSLHKKAFEGDFIDLTSKDTEKSEKRVIEPPAVTEESKTEVHTEEKPVENTESPKTEVENDSVVNSVIKEPVVVEEKINESTPAEDVIDEEAHTDNSADTEESEDTDVKEDEGETLSVEGEESVPVSANNDQQNNYNKKKKKH